MKLVTWNINSVRIRLEHVKKLVQDHNPDVICFQETKVRDEQFPLEDLQGLGYPHTHFRGEKSYNGVAILSKIPFEGTDGLSWCEREDKRHVSVVLEGGVELNNFYIPAGGDEPDAEKNPKFAHKLQFLDEMTVWSGDRYAEDKKRIMVGDFNIAPLETDVWDHKKLKNIITHTAIEIDRLDKLQASGQWVDAMRMHILPDEKCFTWWSYRARDWRASNKGRRLDHVWVTPNLKDGVKACEVLLDLRGEEKPSDHAPVLVEIAL
ncbi:exodeoxyribonuclease III [Terasakiella sp. A23]|uniref:exodeoxyribonuclease III n=1 Tax=Terasakiella sp. FCG-A23 TaxID=3080561 RepID=UPI0029531327|nr:exodeoxyribonuclease III [Terasakiella sp. A23]MDV7341169.1 exodeoxyribonuclease III [Terasakiella sp. A23]